MLSRKVLTSKAKLLDAAARQRSGLLADFAALVQVEWPAKTPPAWTAVAGW